MQQLVETASSDKIVAAVAMPEAAVASKQALFSLNCSNLNRVLDAYIGSPDMRATVNSRVSDLWLSSAM